MMLTTLFLIELGIIPGGQDGDNHDTDHALKEGGQDGNTYDIDHLI